MADNNPARDSSPPETMALARRAMTDIRTALTKDPAGNYPASHADMRAELGIQPDGDGWEDMLIGDRYDILMHGLDTLSWSHDGNTSRHHDTLAAGFVLDEWRLLNAEIQHDTGLRHLADRGVKYEDHVERQLDPAHRAQFQTRDDPRDLGR